jgi:hypothetical protein
VHYNADMAERMITAVDMARDRGIKPKAFRDALRRAKFPWHGFNDRWTFPEGSPEHLQMAQVLASLGDS